MHRFSRAVTLIALCCTATLPATRAGEENGYFLSLSQKGSLIWQGRIRDSSGTDYNIRIVPGYAPPAERAGKNLAEAGGNLGEYFDLDKYDDMWDVSTAALEWGWEDCLTEFALKGSVKAWGKYFGAAQKRTGKRLFGWWLAYPWALMQSTVDNVVRIPVGLTGTAAGTTVGIAGSPAFYLTNSSIKAGWNSAAEGVAFPGIAWGWNSVVSPPLALFGQKPAPSRADGFWVQPLEKEIPPPDDKTLDAVGDWGRFLQSELAPYQREQRQLAEQTEKETKAIQDQIRALREKMYELRTHKQKKMQNIRNTATQHLKQALAEPESKELLNTVRELGWTTQRLSRFRNMIRARLAEKGLSENDISTILELLAEHPPSQNLTPIPPGQADKTDPLTESIRVIEGIEK